MQMKCFGGKKYREIKWAEKNNKLHCLVEQINQAEKSVRKSIPLFGKEKREMEISFIYDKAMSLFLL